ncbi:branched-chain amino acid ABC transporter permease [Xanthobacteraceae bacterium A53D]
MRRYLTSPYLPVLFIAVVIVLLPWMVGSSFHLRIATLVAINAIVVVGLNLFIGYTGQISLGHAAFFAFGAYAVAIGPTHLGIAASWSLLISLVIAGLVAGAIGKPLLRFKGHHLAVATLALGVMVSILANNEVPWTGGPDGMAVGRMTIAGWRLAGVSTWYWIAGTALLLSMAMVANLLLSPTGRALRAIHDSEVAASVLGINVARYKLLALVLSAELATLAGAFLALFDGHVTPNVGGVLRSVEFVTMAVVGGLGSILGSVVGPAILVILPQALTSFKEYELAILGAIMVIVMVALRKGVVPSLLSILLRRVG